MVTVETFKEATIAFVNNKLTEILGNGIGAKVFKPVIVIGMKNNIDKIDSVVKFLLDKDGKFDAVSLINQYEETILNDSEITTFNILNGNIDIGDGKIKISHPYLDKNLVFGTDDVEEFRNLLTPKKAKKDVSET